MHDSKSAEKVFPTHVGVFPSFVEKFPEPLSLPHARGGVSKICGFSMQRVQSSPRTWGCFFIILLFFYHSSVFPTHVGVFPRKGDVRSLWRSLPHARGGVSYAIRTQTGATPVFPTHVGVFLFNKFDSFKSLCLPHARGGVSIVGMRFRLSPESSPRMWGCFRQYLLAERAYYSQ